MPRQSFRFSRFKGCTFLAWGNRLWVRESTGILSSSKETGGEQRQLARSMKLFTSSIKSNRLLLSTNKDLLPRFFTVEPLPSSSNHRWHIHLRQIQLPRGGAQLGHTRTDCWWFTGYYKESSGQWKGLVPYGYFWLFFRRLEWYSRG